MAAHLTITRPKGGRRDKLRAYRIEVNGARIGEIHRDGRLDLDVPVGVPIAVQARIDFTGSPVLSGTLAEGETAHIEVDPKRGWFVRPSDLQGDNWSPSVGWPDAPVLPRIARRPGADRGARPTLGV